MVSNRSRVFKDILWFLALFGLVAGLFRMWFGLGATTNLSDAMPWGLWKVLNMIAGVALSTAGFTIGFLVYVLKLKQFKPLVKPAILIAFLGYGSSCAALLFDIGLPQRFWHPVVMWNEHSFLFEVFWCVMLYFTVTAIELSPTILKRLGMEKLAGWLHRIAFGAVVLGISLSSLHHSSLGSLFLVTPLRLHDLWYTPMLPWFFIISAIGAGMMFAVLARIIYAYFCDPAPIFGTAPDSGMSDSYMPACARPDTPITEERPQLQMLQRLAVIAATILGGYLLFKVLELWSSGSWRTLFAGGWEAWLFIIELVLAALLPIILVAIPRSRRSPYGLGAAAASASFGLALNRLDVGIFGYFHDATMPYFPSLAEWALSIGVVAAAVLVFFAISEYFPIFDERWRTRRDSVRSFAYSFDKLSHVWNAVLTSSLQRRTIIIMFAIPLAWLMLYPPFQSNLDATYEIQPPRGIDPARAVLLIDGDRNNLQTEFPHLDHQERLGKEQSCGKCHHICLPNDNATPCSRCHRNLVAPTDIFDHESHLAQVAAAERLTGLHPANHSCVVCHQDAGPNSAANAKACTECHREDMRIKEQLEGKLTLASASSFQSAMHKNCISCHEEQEQAYPEKKLPQCSTCHASLQAELPAVTQAGL